MPPQLITERSADLSEDGVYRWSLRRSWLKPLLVRGPVLWIGHNPSTADASVDDPTVRRMVQFSDTWGYASLSIANLLPIRTPTAKDAHQWFLEEWPLEDWFQPNGRAQAIIQNASAVIDQAERAGLVIACWGAIASKIPNLALDMRQFFARLGKPLHVLGLTQEGYPIHPMARGRNRVSDSARPQEWVL